MSLALLLTCVAGCNSKESVIKLPSGLEYSITQPGTGEQTPRPGQMVTVDYTGWLDDGKGKPGKKFDSSVDRKQPFVFKIGIGQVIKGWDEGVMSMKVGEKRRLYIPAHLAYGARGNVGIPGNAKLIFDVHLIKIG